MRKGDRLRNTEYHIASVKGKNLSKTMNERGKRIQLNSIK
jgi:hypothetical protein